MSAAAETFVARLDRVPLNRFHWRLLVLSGLGWMFDAMDVLMLSFLLTPIRGEFKRVTFFLLWRVSALMLTPFCQKSFSGPRR